MEHTGARSVPRPTDESTSRRLGDLFDPRSNSLDVMRLVFAGTVALAHALHVAYGPQPVIGSTELGALAVDGFFVLSGFLVAMSFVRLGSLGRYVWHRFLRIMPGFWVCLLVTAFAIAPLVSVLEGAPAGAAFAGPEPAWAYPLHNGLLYMVDFAVGGLPTGTQSPGVVNGALWTLFYEATCYGLVACLGVAGLLSRHRRSLVVALTAVVWAALLGQAANVLPDTGDLFLRFFFVFLLGTCAYLFADRLPITGALTVGAVVLLGLSLALLEDYRVLGGVAFAYLCMVLVVRTPWLRYRPRMDLSYGLYVYHWPIEVVLVLAGAAALGPVPYVALALGGAALAAAVSWTLVEKPALSLKNVGRRRPRPRPIRTVEPPRSA